VLAGAALSILFLCSVIAVAVDWTTGGARHPVVSQGKANAIAVSTITGSQPGTQTWVVTHSDFYPTSARVWDAAGSPRFGTSWVPCPRPAVEEGLRRLGLGCPPPPVWAVEVVTDSRSTYRKALVEIDAVTGKALAWQVDDSLP
jgi:hypothetical protein